MKKFAFILLMFFILIMSWHTAEAQMIEIKPPNVYVNLKNLPEQLKKVYDPSLPVYFSESCTSADNANELLVCIKSSGDELRIDQLVSSGEGYKVAAAVAGKTFLLFQLVAKPAKCFTPSNVVGVLWFVQISGTNVFLSDNFYSKEKPQEAVVEKPAPKSDKPRDFNIKNIMPEVDARFATIDSSINDLNDKVDNLSDDFNDKLDKLDEKIEGLAENVKELVKPKNSSCAPQTLFGDINFSANNFGPISFAPVRFKISAKKLDEKFDGYFLVDNEYSRKTTWRISWSGNGFGDIVAVRIFTSVCGMLKACQDVAPQYINNCPYADVDMRVGDHFQLIMRLNNGLEGPFKPSRLAPGDYVLDNLSGVFTSNEEFFIKLKTQDKKIVKAKTKAKKE